MRQKHGRFASWKCGAKIDANCDKQVPNLATASNQLKKAIMKKIKKFIKRMNISLSNETFRLLTIKSATLGTKYTDHVRELIEKDLKEK